MYVNNANKESLKQIKAREKKEQDDKIREMCELLAIQRLGEGGENRIKELSNQYKGLWYLPALNEDGTVEKMLVFKPIDRHALSYASTKITDEGLYAFLEAAMNECLVKELSDVDMMVEDDYFIPAANTFNKIIEGRKTTLVKR